jgi:hypothetical protein
VDHAAKRPRLEGHTIRRLDQSRLRSVLRTAREIESDRERVERIQTSGEVEIRARAPERRGSVLRLKRRSIRDYGQLSDENDSHHEQFPFGLNFGKAGRSQPNSAQVRKK